MIRNGHLVLKFVLLNIRSFSASTLVLLAVFEKTLVIILFFIVKHKMSLYITVVVLLVLRLKMLQCPSALLLNKSVRDFR